MMTIHLEHLLPSASRNQPGWQGRKSLIFLRKSHHPYSVLLPVGFAMPLPLPAARCALTAPFHPYPQLAQSACGGRFVLCGTFPGVAPAGRYPAPFFRGARTFLHRNLSVIAAAVTQPTDWRGLGICKGHVNKTLKVHNSGPILNAV
jgi:hypothetical protein